VRVFSDSRQTGKATKKMPWTCISINLPVPFCRALRGEGNGLASFDSIFTTIQLKYLSHHIWIAALISKLLSQTNYVGEAKKL
jgi:hypothetical protein